MKKVFTIGFILFIAFTNNAKAQLRAWELSWNFQGTHYEALLWYPKGDEEPMMRVKYYNSGTQVVEESFVSASQRGVTILKGYAPKFIYSENSKARYTADNLVIYDSHLYFLNDTEDIYNPYNWVEITNVKQLYTQNYFKIL